jgi:hypothetical protein
MVTFTTKTSKSGETMSSLEICQITANKPMLSPMPIGISIPGVVPQLTAEVDRKLTTKDQPQESLLRLLQKSAEAEETTLAKEQFEETANNKVLKIYLPR